MMNGNAIRGSRLGSGPTTEAERGEPAPRIPVSFWCANRHETRPSFAVDAVIPETWECPRCGNPAGQNERNPPPRPRVEPYKTHLAYVKERRSDSDGETILAEALARCRTARGEGRDSPGQRERGGDHDLPGPAPAPPAPSGKATTPGNTRDAPPPAAAVLPGTIGAPPLRTATDPARHAGEGPRAAGPIRGTDRADGSPVQAAGDAVPPQARLPASDPPGGAEPALPDPPAGRRHGKCGYRFDSPSHKGICLGQR